MRRTSHTEAGFTLVELLLAIILTGMIVTTFIATLLNMVSTATIQKVQLELNQKNQIALDIIERDVRLAISFGTTIPVTTPATFSDSYGPANTNEGWTGAWSYKGDDADHRVLILKEIATTTNPLRATRTPVYVDATESNVYTVDASLNCTAYNASSNPTGALTYNPKLPYYLIYFIRDHTLYRRTVTDIQTALCNGPQYQKQSCPEVDSDRPATCIANDEQVAGDVSSFTITYNSISYDNTSGVATSSSIDAYNSSDSDVFDEISNVTVTLTLQKIVSGQNRSSTLSINVSKVN